MIPPLVPTAIAFAVGILLATGFPLSPGPLLVVGLIAGGAGLGGRRHPRASALALVILWGCAGGLCAASSAAVAPADVSRLVGEAPQPARIQGIVVDDPVESFSPQELERQVCVVRARHVGVEGRWQEATGLIRVRLQAPRLTLDYGDEVLLEGRWSAVPPPGNPGQFDWRAALARQRIHGLLAVHPFDGVVRVRSHHGHWWLRGIYALRQRVEGVLQTRFTRDHAGLLRSLLLGQRVALEDGLKRAFVQTGTMHLLVISGFNVGLVAWLLELAFRFLGVPLRPRLLLCGVSLVGYCVLTGMQPPVVRATIMAGVVLGGVWMDRVVNWPNALAAAALGVLWWNPSQVFEPGFQLSFGAVASLLAFVSRIRAILEPRVSVRATWLRRYVAVSLASTLAIWIGLWPVLAWYFHLVSPISVLANLLLVPLVSLTVAYGTPLVLLGTMWTPVVTCTAGTMTWLVDGIVQLVQWCQAVPFGCWLVGQPSWWVIGGYYGLVVLTLLRSRLRWSPARVASCWLAGIAVWVWGALGAAWCASRWLEVTVLDVGHGDSIVIRTPNRQTILVDTGTRQAGQYTVVPFLHFKGWNTLDALLLTHPDEDHVGGAIPLLDGVRVKRLLTNGFPATTQTAQSVVAGADARRIPRAVLTAGMRLTGAPGVEMLVLHPPAGFVPGTSPGSNDNSLVIRLHMRRVGMLLCGDLEEGGVPWVLRWGPVLGSTMLKVPHHGSALGPLGRRFLEQVHPAEAVISVGRLHGLPSAEVLRDLTAVGAEVFLTRRDGAVTVRTDGTRVFIETFRGTHARRIL